MLTFLLQPILSQFKKFKSLLQLFTAIMGTASAMSNDRDSLGESGHSLKSVETSAHLHIYLYQVQCYMREISSRQRRLQLLSPQAVSLSTLLKSASSPWEPRWLADIILSCQPVAAAKTPLPRKDLQQDPQEMSAFSQQSSGQLLQTLLFLAPRYRVQIRDGFQRRGSNQSYPV